MDHAASKQWPQIIGCGQRLELVKSLFPMKLQVMLKFADE